MIGRLVSGILNILPHNAPTNGFLRSSLDVALAPQNQCQWNFTSIRTKFFYRTKPRYGFPKPSEHKRVTTYGWQTRMSTLSGRKVIMRRILKGKHVLSH